MSSAEYTVRLDAFEGPLDLLLHLIRRAEVEINDIPIAAIASQYLAFLRQGGIESIDIETAGEFLVMAATLMEIKSRMLAPPEDSTTADAVGEPGDARNEGDPRADLVRQLLAYKKFRDAADQLDAHRREWESRFPARAAAVDDARVREAAEADLERVEIDEIGIGDLLDAFARIIETVDFDRLGEHQVFVDETPIELHADDLLDRLKQDADSCGQRRPIEFASIFAGRTRAEMIGLFLAMLELVRQRRLGVQQDDHGSGIMLTLLDQPAESAQSSQD